MHPDPTDLDRARDLSKDLELCERAAAPPWLANEQDVEDADGMPVLTYETVLPKGSENAQMIAESREGWPAALRRALWAEAFIARHLDPLSHAQDKLEAAEAEIARLRDLVKQLDGGMDALRTANDRLIGMLGPPGNPLDPRTAQKPDP